MGGGAEEGQCMGTALVLATFPMGDVVKDVRGIFVGPFVYCGMRTEFKGDFADGTVDQAWLNAESREGVALHHIAVELIVLEECQCSDFQGKAFHEGGILLIVFGAEAAVEVSLCSCCRCDGKGGKEKEVPEMHHGMGG